MFFTKLINSIKSAGDKIYKINILYSHRYIIITIISFMMIIVGSYYLRHLFKHKFIHNSQNFVVKFIKVSQQDVPIIVSANGKVQAINNVLIKSQVDGTILKAHFNEGAMIKQGQLLFDIDPKPLNSLYNQAVANVNRSMADLSNSELQLDKYTALYQKKFISLQEHQQFVTNFKIAKANYAAALASLATSKTQLDFTKIYSPINGIAGQILVKPGNLVKIVNNLGLVNINQLNPIHVVFNISDEYLAEIISNIHQLATLQVNLPDYYQTGKLVFVDNHVDELSGTILLKAEFCNLNHALWPGKFVNVDLHIKTLPQALVVPNNAVQFGQQNHYVYTLSIIKNLKQGALAKVKKVPVKIGYIFNHETVILDGVQVAQMVVTEGHGHLIDDMLVEIYANQ